MYEWNELMGSESEREDEAKVRKGRKGRKATYLPKPLDLLVGCAPVVQLRVGLEVVQVHGGEAAGEELELGGREDGDEVLMEEGGGGGREGGREESM